MNDKRMESSGANGKGTAMVAGNMSCLSRYRADVDEYERVIVHAISATTGATLCGRRAVASRTTKWERTDHQITCVRCRRIAAAK